MNLTNDITNKQLTNFGLILSAGIAIIFGIILPYLKTNQVLFWPIITGGVILFFSICFPRALKLIYTPWMALGNILGTINTNIILGLIYYLLITPFGLTLRLFSRKNQDHANNSYKKINKEQSSPKHMERPF